MLLIQNKKEELVTLAARMLTFSGPQEKSYGREAEKELAMGNAYRVYTIVSGQVSEGAEVQKFALRGAGVDIPAILLGETGRGRSLGILPVDLPNGLYGEWQEKGKVRIVAAEVGETKAGKPKLFAKDAANSNEKLVCVFKTGMGYRGGNSHTGDGYIRPCSYRGKELKAYHKCPECEIELFAASVDSETMWKGILHPDKGGKVAWHPFPGQVLCTGVIADGAAGRRGSGEQLVVVMPADEVFRTGYSGRLYGRPSAHYYKLVNVKLLALTWDERTASDLF